MYQLVLEQLFSSYDGQSEHIGWNSTQYISYTLSEALGGWGGGYSGGKKDRDDRRKSQKTTLKNTKP